MSRKVCRLQWRLWRTLHCRKLACRVYIRLHEIEDGY